MLPCREVTELDPREGITDKQEKESLAAAGAKGSEEVLAANASVHRAEPRQLINKAFPVPK